MFSADHRPHTWIRFVAAGVAEIVAFPSSHDLDLNIFDEMSRKETEDSFVFPFVPGPSSMFWTESEDSP